MPTAGKPSWEEIYGGRLPSDLPPVPRKRTPRVDAPTCPDDCSGRHGLEAHLFCENCRVPAYQDWWHEYQVNRGVNFHTLVAVNGAPTLDWAHMPCPVCGGQFRK